SGSGGFMDKINGVMGGGSAGEKNKAIDFVQEKMGVGGQLHESAMEQAKDNQIAE
ncbi:hypothetical protein B0H17DRAFT_863696, partial [Mycena rosella]